MMIGYARTSTLQQVAGVEAQERDLRAVGCHRMFVEQCSSVGARPQLEALIAFLREGDIMAVTTMSRLARSMRHLCDIEAQVQAKGASLRILDMNLDSSTSTGRLVMNVLGSVAQHEREQMLERQREGIAAAKAAGKYKGRVPTAQRQADKVRSLAAAGHKPSEIARELDLGRTSVWRILRGVEAQPVA